MCIPRWLMPVFVIGLLLSCCPALSAATVTWNGGTANWNSANWSTGMQPATTDTADFSAGGTCTIEAVHTIAAITGTLTADMVINGGSALTLGSATAGITAMNTATAKTLAISCPVVMSNNQTWDGTADITISGAITGNKDLTWNGASTLDIQNSISCTGTNTFTISAGIYKCSHASGLGSANSRIIVVNAATLIINAVTVSGAVLTLNNGSTFKGLGAASFGTYNSSGYDSTVTDGGTTTITYGSATDVFTLLCGWKQSTGNIIIAGTVGTAGGKVVAGGNSATWTNGNVTINQYATLEGNSNNAGIGTGGGTGTITVDSGGSFRLQPLSTGNLTIGKNITITGDGQDGNGALMAFDNTTRSVVLSGTLTLAAAASIGGTGILDHRLNSVISGDFTLTKRGVGLWNFRGNSSTWGGNIVVAAGTLYLDAATSSGNGLGNTTGTTTVQSGGTLQVLGTTSVGENLTISGSGAGGIGALSGTGGGGTNSTLAGTIALAANASIGNLPTTGALICSGALSGGFNLTKVGTGVVRLTGDSNAWGGNVTVSDGTLQSWHSSALGDATGTTTVSSGASLTLQGGSITTSENFFIAGTGYGGAGALNTSTGYSAYNLNGNITLQANATMNLLGGTTIVNGTISDGGSNYTLTCSGSTTAAGAIPPKLTVGNTYGGGTNLTAGIWRITHATALGTPGVGATVTVSSGACVQMEIDSGTLGAYPFSIAGTGYSSSGAIYHKYIAGAGTLTMQAGSTITLTADAAIQVDNAVTHILDVYGALSGAFALTKLGAGLMVLNAASPGYTGATANTTGRLTVKSATGLGTTPANVTVNSGSLYLDGVSLATTNTLSLNGTGGGNGALNGNGTCGWGGPVTLTAAAIIFCQTSTTCTIGGALSGSFDLTKYGAGTLVLNGNSSGYSNLITLSNAASRLIAGHNNALGTNAALTVPNNYILELNGANIPTGKTLTLSGNGGAATTGALVLTGTCGWAGPVALAASTTIGGTGIGTISGQISAAGAFTLTKCNAGTLKLSGDNSGYSRAISFYDGSSGRIVAAHNSALGTATPFTVTAGDTLELNGAQVTGINLTINGTGDAATGSFLTTGASDSWAGTVTLGAASTIGGTGAGTISGILGGAYALTKAGTGSWSLSNTNTYTTSTINAGKLAIISPGTAGSGAVTVNATGTLAGTGTVAGAVTVAGGTIAPGTAAGSIGTLTLTTTLGGTSGSCAMGLSGASADQIVVNGAGTPVTFTNLTLDMSGTLTSTVSLITFPAGTNATTFSSYTGKPSNCAAPTYETNSVDLRPYVLDLVWTVNCTGTGTTTNRNWALGTLVPGYVVTSESGTWAQVFELRNDSETAADITITCSNAVGGTIWTNSAAAGADAFLMEMKPAAGAYANLTTGRILASALAVSGTKAFDLRFSSPTTSTDSTAKTMTITATATVP